MKGAAAFLLPALLAAQEQLRIERTLFLRTGSSHRLAWSPDGRWIASGGDCGEVLVLEAATGKVEHELEASDHWIGGLAFAPDGSALAVVGRDLSVWNLPAGSLRGRHPVAGATAVVWSADGSLLGCTLTDGTAAMLDAGRIEVVRRRNRAVDSMSGQQVHGFAPGAGPVSGAGQGVVAIAPGGVDWVRARGNQLEFFTYKELQRTLPLPHRASPTSVALPGSGRYVALGDDTSPIEVFALADGSRVDLRGTDLRGSLPTLRAGDELVLWQPPVPELPDKTGRLSMWSIDALRDGLPSLVRKYEFARIDWSLDETGRFSPDGRFIAVSDRVCDLLRPGESWSVPCHLGQSLVPAAGGARALRVTKWRGLGPRGGSGSLELFGADGTRQQQLDLDEFPWDVAWSPDGQAIGLLISSGVRLLDPGTLVERQQWPGRWHQLAWVDAGRLLLLEDGNGLSLLDLAVPDGSTRLELGSRPQDLSLDHRGELAAVALHDRVLLVRIAK